MLMSKDMSIFYLTWSYVSVGGRYMNVLKQRFYKLDEVKRGLILLALGIVLGFLFAKIFKNLYWNQIDLMDSTYFNKIRSLSIDYSVLLKYIFWKNYRIYIIFWILSCTPLGKPYITLSVLYMGFQSSFFATAILMKYSLKGILLIIGYTIPQYIIYLPIIFLCLRSGYWLCNSMYYDMKLSKRAKIEKVLRHLVVIIVLGGILMVGGLLEGYAGSSLLKKILTLF